MKHLFLLCPGNAENPLSTETKGILLKHLLNPKDSLFGGATFENFRVPALFYDNRPESLATAHEISIFFCGTVTVMRMVRMPTSDDLAPFDLKNIINQTPDHSVAILIGSTEFLTRYTEYIKQEYPGILPEADDPSCPPGSITMIENDPAR